jgi:hypothetical protein
MLKAFAILQLKKEEKRKRPLFDYQQIASKAGSSIKQSS